MILLSRDLGAVLRRWHDSADLFMMKRLRTEKFPIENHFDDGFILTIDGSDEIETESLSESEQNNPGQSRIERVNEGQKSNLGRKSETGEAEFNSSFQFPSFASESTFQKIGADESSTGKPASNLEKIIERKRQKFTSLLTEGAKDNEFDLKLEHSDKETLSFSDCVAEENEFAGIPDYGSDNRHEKENFENKDDTNSTDETISKCLSDEDYESNLSSDTDSDEDRMKEQYFEKVEVPSNFQKDFQSLKLSRPILKAITELNFDQPTAIQERTIPVALLGHDIVGSAITGSGKTAAFVIPILERLLYKPRKELCTRVLILCPTRELTVQCYNVAVNLAKYCDISICLAAGGFNLRMQENELKMRPDIIVGTPGRFIDLARNSKGFHTERIEVLVLDEADRMLDQGFADELDEILRICPKSRQTLLFSATVTEKVEELIRLSLKRPIRITVDERFTTSSSLLQEFVRVRTKDSNWKIAIFLSILDVYSANRTIIFFNNKNLTHRVHILLRILCQESVELHGNLTQEQRNESLQKFKDGKVKILLATDLAARGLDIKSVELVVNFDAPSTFEAYLHRIGRTARAGKSGRAITLYVETEHKLVKRAKKYASRQGLTVESTNLSRSIVSRHHARIEKLQKAVDDIIEEEKHFKMIENLDQDLKKSQNLIEHEDEINSRPKRTWFRAKKQRNKTNLIE